MVGVLTDLKAEMDGCTAGWLPGGLGQGTTSERESSCHVHHHGLMQQAHRQVFFAVRADAGGESAAEKMAVGARPLLGSFGRTSGSVESPKVPK
jgi:hypothetical protein